MNPFLFWLALLTLFFFTAFGLVLARCNRSTEYLKDIPPWQGSFCPRVSVVIPARNEEKHIQEALQSVLRQDYANMEVIVLNDRSTDGTGAILDRMTRAHPELRAVHLSKLPRGWLGKNHALQMGAEQASGEYLLFTDADVVMDPSTLSRAMEYMTKNQVDHLTVGPEVRMPGLLLQLFAGVFTIFFALYARPWKVKDPKSASHVGIGAFNLLRADVYRAIGTHQAIAMRPDDDMKLGLLVKTHGFQQRVLFAEEVIHVEWYSSLSELVSGLEKNAFAGIDYNPALTAAGTLFQFLFFVWPFAAVFATSGITQIINAAVIAMIVLLYRDNARFHNQNPWYVVGFPVAVMIFIYIMWNSTLKTLRNDGIDWRGTHYSLAELKANRVRRR